jgi:hypothetical protein|nr:MAG TPA: hypothetical protein [Caudoviricetes sp.]
MLIVPLLTSKEKPPVIQNRIIYIQNGIDNIQNRIYNQNVPIIQKPLYHEK